MTLRVDIAKQVGDFALAAKFTSDGRVTALFGPSGSGKTTLVNLIAGLVRPDRGAIEIDGVVLFDHAAGTDVPARKRRVGYVFQEGRLFPHYSVKGNLLYGGRRSERHAGDKEFGAVVDLLGIAGLLDRRPASLSGGEKQRVAIGRALLASPRLLLMDEPLASLDDARKAEILPYIERLRDELRLPIVYVSHAIEEVARIADSLVLLAAGRTVATGTVNEVLGRLDFRALTGQHEASVVLTARVLANDREAGTTILDHPAGGLTVPLQGAAKGAPVRLRIRARDVALAVGDPGRLSIRNRLAATVAGIAPGPPPDVEIRLDIAGDTLLATITGAALVALDLKVGQPVTALIKSASFDRFSLGSGRSE